MRRTLRKPAASRSTLIKYNVTVEAELGQLAGVEDEVSVEADKAQFTDPEQVQDFRDPHRR